jgi:pimeloyl-ACP methyl ester carboxylesterase
MNTWVIAAIALLVVSLAGVVYQTLGLAGDARRFPPPGRLVDVGGYRLHAVCSGHGAPGVVLESAIAASSLSWSKVLAAVAQLTRVCAYDRAGFAWSDGPAGPRTFARLVDDLDACVAKVQCPAPLVLVGHSFGTFLCLAYAARHPGKVAGLVLVDPPTEWMHMDRRQRRMVSGAVLLSGVGGWLARLGVVRACLALLTGGAPGVPRYFVKVFGPTTARTLERLVGEVQKLPPEIHPVVKALWCRPKCFRAMADHLRALDEAVASARGVGSLGELPVVVISSSRQTPDVTAAHAALAGMSSQGRVVVASKSGHWVPYDEPELIVDAIRGVVQGVRDGRAGTGPPN